MSRRINPVEKTMFNLKTLAGVIASFGIATAAQALPISSTFQTGATQWSDDSAEILIDRDGSGTLSAGDWLVGVLQITSFPTAVPSTASSYNTLTAFFANEVSSVSNLPALACGNAVLTSCGLFEFVPITDSGLGGGLVEAIAAINFVFGAGTIPAFNDPDGLAAAMNSNTAALFFEDVGAQTPVDREDPIEDGFTAATDGVLRMVLDMENDWSAIGPQDLTQFTLLPEGGAAGSFGTELTIAAEGFANVEFTSDKVQVIGNLYAPTDEGTWPVNDDATFTMQTRVVPEPSSLALLGIAALGAATMRRRSKKTA